MRWKDKTKAYWVRVIGEELYNEKLHIDLQDYIEARHSGVAIFFQEQDSL